MSHDFFWAQTSIVLEQSLCDLGKSQILLVSVGSIVCALKFYANREVVAILSILEFRFTRVPSSLIEGYKLDYFT